MTRVNREDQWLYVGQIVHWFPSGDRGQQPWPAIVTRIHDLTIGVTAFSPGTRDGRTHDGVRHMSDPLVRREETRDAGGWDHTPQTKLLQDVLGGGPVNKNAKEKAEPEKK